MVSRETIAASAAGFGAVTVVAVKKTATTATRTEAKLSASALALQAKTISAPQGALLSLTVTSWETLKSLFSAAEELRLSTQTATYPVIMCGESRIMTAGQYVTNIWNPLVGKRKLPVNVTVKISGRRNRSGKAEALPIPEAKPARAPRPPRTPRAPKVTTPNPTTTES